MRVTLNYLFRYVPLFRCSGIKFNLVVELLVKSKITGIKRNRIDLEFKMSVVEKLGAHEKRIKNALTENVWQQFRREQ